MSRMRHVAAALLLVAAGVGIWYGTREVTRSQDRAGALAGQLAEAQARADRMTRRAAEMEARLATTKADLADVKDRESTLAHERELARRGAEAAQRERDEALADLDRLRAEREAAEERSSSQYGPIAPPSASLHALAAGMTALDRQLEVILNNLANVNTIGFKRSRLTIRDVVPAGLPGEDQEPDGEAAGPDSEAPGSRIPAPQVDFSPGAVDSTTRPLDLAIEGEGFFQVRIAWHGTEVTAYTRAGNFTRDSAGNFVLAGRRGSPLDPPITIPDDIPDADIVVDHHGLVAIRQRDDSAMQVGQIELARFVNCDGLAAISGQLFLETNASGPPITAPPGEEGLGTLVQSALESSNVDPLREQVELMRAQQAFQLGSRVLPGVAAWEAVASPLPVTVVPPRPEGR